MKSINQHTGFILPWKEMKFFYRSILYPYTRVTLSIGGAGAGGERGREGGREAGADWISAVYVASHRRPTKIR